MSKFVVGEGLTNSYDTWHGEDILYTWLNDFWFCLGTKNVGKQMLKISSGLVRNKGVSWFPEFVDKSKCIIHIVLFYGETHSFRKKHQNPPLLGHEKLWGKCRHPQEPHR